MLDGLWSECDLGNENKGAFSESQYFRDGAKIDFGFAAAGDAVQENDARFFSRDFFLDDFQRGGLFGVGG